MSTGVNRSLLPKNISTTFSNILTNSFSRFTSFFGKRHSKPELKNDEKTVETGESKPQCQEKKIFLFTPE
mgnify:CR=1 FL=1